MRETALPRRAEREAAFNEKLEQLQQREDGFAAREANLQQREMAVPRREEAIAAREGALLQREERVGSMQAVRARARHATTPCPSPPNQDPPGPAPRGHHTDASQTHAYAWPPHKASVDALSAPPASPRSEPEPA